MIELQSRQNICHPSPMNIPYFLDSMTECGTSPNCGMEGPACLEERFKTELWLCGGDLLWLLMGVDQ